jgi:hypothetical protein
MALRLPLLVAPAVLGSRAPGARRSTSRHRFLHLTDPSGIAVVHVSSKVLRTHESPFFTTSQLSGRNRS